MERSGIEIASPVRDEGQITCYLPPPQPVSSLLHLMGDNELPTFRTEGETGDAR